MSFNTALTAGNYTSIRGGYYANQYLCLWPNEVVFKTTLSATPTGDSYAAVTFGSTISGDSVDVLIGMRVLIGPNDDMQDAIHRARSNNGALDGRVRKAVSGSTLYINETSAELTSGDYVWVIRDYPVMDKLARESGGTYYKDWDLGFFEVAPIVGGLQTAYAGICSGDPEVLSVAFAPTAIAGAYGATITNWTWTIPTGGTITTGTSTTQNITVEFEAGTYDVQLAVTDSGGRVTTRHIYIFAVPSDLSSVVTQGFEGAEISASIDDGYTARVNAFAGVSGVLDNTLAVIFDVPYYNGSAGAIGGNIRMVGRLQSESNRADTSEDASVTLQSAIEIVGAGMQLGRLAAPLLTIVDDETPLRWDEINRATWWRVLAHLLQTHTTFLMTHSLTFSDTTENYRLPYWGVNGGDMMTECNNTAGSIGASMEFAPDGRAAFNRRATQLSSASRTALTTVANWTNQDFISLNIDREHLASVGLVEAAGGTFRTSTRKTAAFLSQAPGTAPGGAVGKSRMPGQALAVNQADSAAEAELNIRTGYYYAEQNPTTELTAQHPAGYGFIVPTRAQWFTWTLTAADTNLRSLAYTTSQRWLLQQVTTRHNHTDGTQTCEAVYSLEVEGTAGETVPPPPTTGITNPLPAIPPIIGIPDLGALPELVIGPNPETLPPFWKETGTTTTTVPDNGNAVVIATATQAWATTNFKTASPAWQEITPTLGPGDTIRDGTFGFTTEYYLLTSNATTSQVFYAPNVFDNPVDWTANDSIEGEYTIIRAGSTAGEIYVYGAGSSFEWTRDYVFSATPTTGFTIDALNSWTASGIEGRLPYFSGSAIENINWFPGTDCTIEQVVIYVTNYSPGSGTTVGDLQIPSGTVVANISALNAAYDSGVITWTGSAAIESDESLKFFLRDQLTVPTSTRLYVTRMTISGSGDPPTV